MASKHLAVTEHNNSALELYHENIRTLFLSVCMVLAINAQADT